ncbi:MAG: tRNA (adenosine(37)-N6)-threonylcarbamoyltransferase complex transferase subunit TsaD [Candidatus Falkowbacteria bacterium]|nr:tRNA (adenosine(37)-N6)-threonylcarbamoyltransferase complex transferase subunit TsaD [Candidatus Falkowbacteria bacterium]
MYILAIETSCDETAASVAEGSGNKLKIISNVVSSQIKIHQKYGGVVPEVAAREHVINIIPVIDEALKKAGLDRKTASKKLSAIGVTIGPGLITSLMIGVETAKSLAYVWRLPLVAVNHIEGHIYSNFIDREKTKFPTIILTVSGGHTQLVLLKNHLSYKTIGETRDDAAGEAFDKAAQLLGLGYPGGPIISKFAEMFDGKKTIASLPRPMLDSKNYDFSFSGLKTALLYATQKDKNFKKKIPEYAFEFQEAVVDVLVTKTIRAAKEYKARSVFLAGGVAANIRLREKLAEEVKKIDLEFSMPKMEYTTDNAAMIASAAYFKFKSKKTVPWQKIKVDPNLEL